MMCVARCCWSFIVHCEFVVVLLVCCSFLPGFAKCVLVFFVGVRCLMCAVRCLTNVVCGVLCVDCCWILYMVVWSVLFVGVDGVLFVSLRAVC